jgi:tetratricopeptide (TPR) repeat protein
MRRATLLLLVVVAGLSSVLLAIATNIATNLLPANWKPDSWLVWSVVAVLAAISVATGVWLTLQARHEDTLRGAEGPPLSSADPGPGTANSNGPRGGEGGVVPAQLPPDIIDFTGRDDEVAALSGRLKPVSDGGAVGVRTVAISAIGGKPGIGKSALAIHLAHQLVDEFPDGQLYVDLRGNRPERLTAPEVLSQFLRELGVVNEQALMDFDEQVARYRTLLAGRKLLVVLDNAADPIQVRPLLPGSPTCAVLITSRSSFHSLEGAAPLTLDVLAPQIAVELLGKLAGPERVAREPSTARKIAEYCGNLPLALRIAGAKLAARPGWPLDTLATRLADERRRLSELQAGDLEVRASFTLSYRDLSRVDARVFRLLGLLDGPDVTRSVVAALTGGGLEDSQQSLERLVDAQLLETPGPDRYRLHDLLRLFAQERVEEEEAEETRSAALRRAIEWYQATLRQASERLGPEHLWRAESGVLFPSYASALSWMEAERPNLVAAIRQAGANRWDALTCLLSQDLFDFFNLRKYWRDWQNASELGLQAAQRWGDRSALGRMLHNHGYVLRDRRNYEEAIALIDESVALFHELDDRFWEGRALGTLGTAYRGQQRFDRAIACYQQSLAIRREVGDRLGEGQAHQALGTTYRQQGHLEEAIEALRESLAIFRELGDGRGESRTLGLLGNTYLEQRHSDEAAHFLNESLAISRETGARYVEGRTLIDLGRLYAGRQRYAEAIECLQHSLTIFQTIGDRYAEGQTLRNLAIVMEMSGDRAAAKSRWDSAHAILAVLDPDEARKIQSWLDQPEQPRSSWSEWGTTY